MTPAATTARDLHLSAFTARNVRVPTEVASCPVVVTRSAGSVSASPAVRRGSQSRAVRASAPSARYAPSRSGCDHPCVASFSTRASAIRRPERGVERRQFRRDGARAGDGEVVLDRAAHEEATRGRGQGEVARSRGRVRRIPAGSARRPAGPARSTCRPTTSCSTIPRRPRGAGSTAPSRAACVPPPELPATASRRRSTSGRRLQVVERAAHVLHHVARPGCGPTAAAADPSSNAHACRCRRASRP